MSPWTEDRFFNGAIRIRQRKDGYRFSIDAVIVASGLAPKAGDTVVDLGTGCGIIPLILAYRYDDIRLVGVEIQPELAKLAEYNCRQNLFEDRLHVVHADIRSLHPDQVNGLVQWVVCNPPYRRPNSGRINPNKERALARHEININLSQLMRTSKKLLTIGGRFVTIYPAERLVELLCEMRSHGIEPKSLRVIHSCANENAKLVLVRGAKGGRPSVEIQSPLEIYDGTGEYSSEVRAMMQP
jgi:tRNA1Val (adenine37-N6)-methyltransferase